MNEKIANFYGRDFLITKDVLTPRPETEQIIDAVLNLVGKPYLPGVKPSQPKLPKNLKILEVGTGSGCIAITLKLELPEAKIQATDISKKALTIAQKNATKHGVNHPHLFIISNLLGNVKFTPENKPDLIVANLPYVDKSWPWVDQNALKDDPDIALYADDHGLKLIKNLITEAATEKIPYLILESDPCQHNQINQYASEKGYKLYETRGFITCYTLLESH